MRTRCTCTSRLLTQPNRRGAALVECALVLPLLLALLVGSIEIGRSVNVRQKLAEAARGGARTFALRTKKTEKDVYAIVDQIMAQANLKNYTVDLTPDPSTAIAQREPVTVTVSIAAGEATWYPTPWFLGADDVISASCVMPADLGETAADDVTATVNSTLDATEDADKVAELSGSTDPNLKALEEEAQKLAEEARRLRELADAWLNRLDEYSKKLAQLDPASDEYAALSAEASKAKQAAYDAMMAADAAELLASEALQKVINYDPSSVQLAPTTIKSSDS